MVHGVYLKGQDVWEWRPSKRDFPLFKKLAHIRDRLLHDLDGREGVIHQIPMWCSQGKLSSSKIYELLRNKYTQREWSVWVWKKYIPPKLSFISWLTLRDRLPTKDRLEFLEVDPRVYYATKRPNQSSTCTSSALLQLVYGQQSCCGLRNQDLCLLFVAALESSGVITEGPLLELRY